MLEALKHIDEVVFFIINEMHSPFADDVMWWVSAGWVFAPLFIFFAIHIYKMKKARAFGTGLVCIALIIGCCDQSSNIAKHTVQRYRPTHNLLLKERVHVVNDYRGGQFGFFSGHAANTFGVATFLFFLIRWWKPSYRWLIFLWPALVGYSRIYLGVHYPSDIFFGALDGFLFGYLFYRLFVYLEKKLNYEVA